MPATIHDHFINKSLLASLDAQAESDPHVAFNTYHPPSSSRQRYYPSQDPFPITSPVIHHHTPFERSAFDFHPQQPPNKSPYLLDSYAQPKPSTSQQQQQQPLQPPPPPQAQQPYAPFSNGVQLASQTPYGPHVPTAAPSAAVSLSMSGNAGPSTTTANGEEISTIFVVGFPEDMQEREFQNMFTFSQGFEAATLKIPNKDYSAYNALMGGHPPLPPNGMPPPRNYSASNDPYNLVTVNQGGVLVDAGRDGVMSSWPAPPPTDDLAAHFAAANGVNGVPNGNTSILPPRKQIIGFAKFRTREEALNARDVLQGRRVDIEKGAVLKAEMAKKNLHTKRGVGPVPGAAPTVGPVGTVLGVVPPGGILVPPGTNGNMHEQPHFGDAFGGIIGNQRSVKNGSGDGEGFMRGARARAEEDEMLRERGMSVGSMGLDGLNGLASKDTDRERLMRLRASNSAAFDAFHSVASGPAASSSGLPGTAPLTGVNGVGVPTVISRQSSTASATASISSAGSLSGSGMWTSPTTIGSEAQSLKSVEEKEGEEDELTIQDAQFRMSLNSVADNVVDSERIRQEGASKDTLDSQDSNKADNAQSAQLHDETLQHLDSQAVDELDVITPSVNHSAGAVDDGQRLEAASPLGAEISDRRQSQSSAHSHSTTLEREQEHIPENDEIVAPWDRITASHASMRGSDKFMSPNQPAAGATNGKFPTAPSSSVPSYAAVARQSSNTAPGPASGSERSTSPTGFSDTQHSGNGFASQVPSTKFQYQHLQYHNDMQAQRLAQQQQQQKQHQNAFGWPSFHQPQWGPAQDPPHFRSSQSESSETSAIGTAPDSHGPGPIGFVGAVSISSAIASRAGLGLGVNTGVSFGTLSDMTSDEITSTAPATRVVNGIERLEDITKPPSSLSSSTSSNPSAALSVAAGDGVSGSAPANGNSPLPPPSSASSIVSTNSAGSQPGVNGASTSHGSSGNISPQLPSPASGSTTSASSSSGLRGTIDQNPPINTLYVGNLPTSPPPLGVPSDYLEETLREVFSARPGFRKLCFRHKANGPMCFVEFEDVAFASKALREMAGDTLRGIVKHGIRLSYSKNPLGVRTPTSAGGSGSSGGPTPLQSQQLMQSLSNHHMYQHNQQGSNGGPQDSFMSRHPDEFNGPSHNRMPPSLMRRDSALSPSSPSGHGFGGMNGNGGGFFSSPPPRFYATSPGANVGFGPSSLGGAPNGFVPRGLNGNGMPPGMFNNGMGNMIHGGFSPFGMPFDNSAFAPQGTHHQQQAFMGGPQQHSMPDGQQQHHHQNEE